MKYLKLFEDYSSEPINNKCKLCDDNIEDGKDMCSECTDIYNETFNEKNIK